MVLLRTEEEATLVKKPREHIENMPVSCHLDCILPKIWRTLIRQTVETRSSGGFFTFKQDNLVHIHSEPRITGKAATLHTFVPNLSWFLTLSNYTSKDKIKTIRQQLDGVHDGWRVWGQQQGHFTGTIFKNMWDTTFFYRLRTRV